MMILYQRPSSHGYYTYAPMGPDSRLFSAMKERQDMPHNSGNCRDALDKQTNYNISDRYHCVDTE